MNPLLGVDFLATSFILRRIVACRIREMIAPRKGDVDNHTRQPFPMPLPNRVEEGGKYHPTVYAGESELIDPVKDFRSFGVYKGADAQELKSRRYARFVMAVRLGAVVVGSVHCIVLYMGPEVDGAVPL